MDEIVSRTVYNIKHKNYRGMSMGSNNLDAIIGKRESVFGKVSPLISALIVLLIQLPAVLFCDTKSQISGKVSDTQSKEMLIGANVILKGTSIGTVTDVDGKFIIRDVLPGEYTIHVSYIGYESNDVVVEVADGKNITRDFELKPVGVQGKEVVVTAQAQGQKGAINQQINALQIKNVVSAARIQELPDANAAESVGRLPGVSLTRSGGEATGVVVRGLEPKYNEILIDGVEMAGTNDNDRSTNLSMISSNSLSGIEVYKTLTPDMDAAVLGGVVNFQIREAETSPTSVPTFHFLTQAGYNDLVSSYGNYKFVGTVEDRYMDDRLGIFAQAIAEKVNRTDDEMGGSFDIQNGTSLTGLHPTILNTLTLSFVPREQKRYDGTLVLDYNVPDGKIDLMNFFSNGTKTTQSLGQTYQLNSNGITFNDSYTQNKLNTVTNLLTYKQTLFSVTMDAKFSHSFSENNTPYSWTMDFWQNAANTGGIPKTLSPIAIAQQGAALINTNQMFFDAFNTSNSYSKQQDFTGSIDFEKSVDFSDMITTTFKAGGDYKHTYRWHSEGDGRDGLYYAAGQGSRAAIIEMFPWMAMEPYNLNPNGSEQLPIAVFQDPHFNYGKFLSGQYTMGPGTKISLIDQAINASIDTSQKVNWSEKYKPDNLDLIKNNYHGDEGRGAGYVMATVNIGPQITFIPGVRFQELTTSYSAPRIYNPSFPYAYPVPYPHQDTTISEYHGYWLPDVSLRYKPLSWFDVRLAYTNTLSYPDFTQLTPFIQIGANSITWHNFALSPAKSQNFDATISAYDNSIGLLSAGGFLKRIDGLIFGTGNRYPGKDWSAFPGVPANYPGLSAFSISYSINDPYRTDVWGIEGEWQTHFWYLPNPLNGLVLNVNLTHIFSGAKYPYTYNYQVGYPPKVVYVDTFYTDRLYQQPNDIGNLSVGYDYKDFSCVVSMIYQSDVFNSNDFWPELRVTKSVYRRWDISAKQGLPWLGLEVFFDINDLNKESDVYIIQGPGFPQSTQDYGMTADLGMRWKL